MAESLVEGGGITSTGWTALGVGVAVLAILVAIAIAWFQRRGQVQDQRKAKPQSSGVMDRQKDEVDKLLEEGARFVWTVLERERYTLDGLNKLGLENFALQASRFAKHGPESLRADLQEVVLKIGELKQHALPAQIDQPGASDWDSAKVKTVMDVAVAQYRAAQGLDSAINEARRRLWNE